MIFYITVGGTPWSLHVRQFWEERKNGNILFLFFEETVKVSHWNGRCWLFIGVGRFRILGGPRFRILGGPRGGQIPSRHTT